MNAVAAVFGAAGRSTAPSPPRAEPRGGAQAARTVVTQMLDRMPERGSGHRVIVADEGGVIGAAGTAPAFASKAGCALIAGDLRLDNAEELRQALGLAGDAAHAVIAVEAFARWGDGFAAHLAGDFALVLIDLPARRLLAVRDPLGIRPLYYRTGVSQVRFASELRVLREAGDAADEGYLAEMLSGDINDVEATPWLSIRRVPAGHLAIAGAHGVSVTRYWQPPRELNRGTLDDHAGRFREAFDAAVRARCDGSSAVGVHLSGGLDSSSVLGSICANDFARPIAGSLRFPWPEADESAWIGAAARRWNVEPIIVDVPVNPPAHGLASIRAHGDLPDDPSGGPAYRDLHRSLKDAGAGAVLTGLGGDQWWSGELAYMADLIARARLGKLRRWRAAGAVMGDAAWSWADFVRHGLLPLVPPVLRSGARRMLPAAVPQWIRKDFAQRVGLRERLRHRPDTSGAPRESWRRMRWRLDSGEEAFMKERFDWFAVESGLEMRHPFYDRRLVDLAFATPDDARIGPATNRAVMREAMASRLAPETAARVSKADLSRLLVEAIRAPDVQPYLKVPSLSGRGWIEPNRVAALVADVVVDGDPAGASPLWRIISVEAWLQQAFGG